MSAGLNGRLADGSAVSEFALDGERVFFVCPRAFPPGAPVALRIEGSDGPVSVDVRAFGSKRRSETVFEVRGRTVSLSRASRERLTVTLGS